MYFSYKNLTLYLLYNFAITVAWFLVKPISLFNKKLALGTKGRQEAVKKIHQFIQKSDKTMWFHCSSLGEYEQGLPVFNEAKKLFPNHKVILTFFSPSGYEIRKNAEIADIVAYLPFDTKKNAKQFIQAVHPDITIYVKYEIWPNMLNELHKTNSHSILISALFRKNQSIFKWYSAPARKALLTFNHIFTQNESSKHMLNSIGYNAITVAGDTRFDRVTNQLKQNNNLDFIEEFKQKSLCVVIGSSWPEDEKVMIDFINTKAHNNTKFIIAPHNIKAQQIKQLQKSIQKKTVLYSEKENKQLSDYQVFIIDTIGLLSKIYNYADVAYVGGAMGTTGLHNTLEPATFGVPIVIGKNYSKFPEAEAMIAKGGMKTIANIEEFNSALLLLTKDENTRKTLGQINLTYIKDNLGAVEKITNYLRNID